MAQDRVLRDAQRPPRYRRSGSFLGRRLAFALTLACVLPVWVATAARADNAGQQVIALIYKQGEQTPSQEVTTIGQLEAGCSPTYRGNIEFYSADGTQEPDQQISQQAWTVTTALGCLQPTVPIAAVKGITILRQGASDPEVSPNSQLTPADLAPNQSDFNNTSEWPIIYSDQSNIIYDRPWRGLGDANARDQVTVPASTGPFEMEVFEGPPLDVQASASQTTVPAGTTVTLSATATGADDGGVSYAWYVSGQQFATGASTQLPLASAGTYVASVQAIDAAGGSGSASVTITVTGQNQPPGSQPTAPSSANPSPTGALAAPPGGSGGTGTGTTPHVGSATGTGHHSATTSTTTAAAKTAAHGAAKPSTSATAPSRATVAVPPAPHQSNRTAARHRRSRAPASSLGSSLVSGRLIGHVSPLAAGRSPLVHVVPASLGTAPQQRRPLTPSDLPALAGALAAALLFGLGVGRELRARARARLRFGG